MISQPGLAYTLRPMRRALSALALLATLLLAPSPGRAAALPAPLAPASAVRSGDEVVTPVPPLPEGVTEFELVLVPDEGPTIQVCAEQRAGVREVRWRVPRLAASRAHLVLRAGGEHAEWESPRSTRFDIAPEDSDVPAWLAGLRSPSALDFDGSSRTWSGFGPAPGAPELSAAGAGPCALPPPAPPALTPPADTRAPAIDSPTDSAPPPGRTVPPRVPTTFPLRN